MEKAIQDLQLRVMEESRRGVYDSLPEFWTQWARVNPGEIPRCTEEFLYTQVPEQYLPKLRVMRFEERGYVLDSHQVISTEEVSILEASRLLSRHYSSLPEHLRELTYDFDKGLLRVKDFSSYTGEVMHYWVDTPSAISFSDRSTRELRRRDLNIHTMLEISPLSYQSAGNLRNLANRVRAVFVNFT